MMNADAYFSIGNGHTNCEDYAIAGTVENGAYAIISDGCSSSPDVDVGARLLTLSAKRTLMIGGSDMSYDLFGKVTIHNLDHIGDTVPLHPHSLDATLLVVMVKDKNFTVHMYGDGVFFHKTATNLRMVHVDFEGNCPAYLSYHLDKLRLKDYETTVLGSKRMLDISLYTGGTPDTQSNEAIENETFMKPFEPVTIKGLADTGDIIAVCSDGVNSFSCGDGSVIPWESITREFIDFKTTPGVFVQRRLSFLKRQWFKNQITHYDDISMAAIVI
jgi:hypothetical protein